MDDPVFSRGSSFREDDEEALRWAALERLPTFDRVRRGILFRNDSGGCDEVEVSRLGFEDRLAVIARVLGDGSDRENFFTRIRERFDR